jgi:hypothetical protein
VVSGVVTERDLLALTWVLEQGVMTVDQLHRAVYQGEGTASSRAAFKRVQFLEASGFLVSLMSPHKKHRFLKATKRAQELLLVRAVKNIPLSLSSPSLSETPHSEILTEIRLAIRDSGKHGSDLWWRGEGTLLEDEGFPKERFRDLMPDAIWVTKSSRRVAIEFERSRKGISRVRKKVEGFDVELGRPDRAFDAVLWVSHDGSYRDLKKALSNRENQILRTIPEFMNELKGESGNG